MTLENGVEVEVCDIKRHWVWPAWCAEEKEALLSPMQMCKCIPPDVAAKGKELAQKLKKEKVRWWLQCGVAFH